MKYIRDRYIIDERLKNKRKSLRTFPTKAEYVLWQELRRHIIGYKFRRQVSIGPYIVDFYCHQVKLVLELDGPIHEDEWQKEHDKVREEWLSRQGYTIIHFTNDEVIFHKREEVLHTILSWCEKLNTLRKDPSLPSPTRGGTR